MELSIFMAFEMGRGSKVTACWGQEGVLKARKIGVLGPLSLFALAPGAGRLSYKDLKSSASKQMPFQCFLEVL